jgi:hypothetical protein
MVQKKSRAFMAVFNQRHQQVISPMVIIHHISDIGGEFKHARALRLLTPIRHLRWTGKSFSLRQAYAFSRCTGCYRIPSPNAHEQHRADIGHGLNAMFTAQSFPPRAPRGDAAPAACTPTVRFRRRGDEYQSPGTWAEQLDWGNQRGEGGQSGLPACFIHQRAVPTGASPRDPMTETMRDLLRIHTSSSRGEPWSRLRR